MDDIFYSSMGPLDGSLDGFIEPINEGPLEFLSVTGSFCLEDFAVTRAALTAHRAGIASISI
jgi:hypothetical protein